MIRSSRAVLLPRHLLMLTVAALIPILAGCEAGNSPPTLSWHYPTNGAGTVVSDISIRNVFILGAPLGQRIPAGHSASLFLALANTGRTDRLLSITAPGTAKTVTLPGGGITLSPSRAILLTGPQPVAVLQDLLRPLYGGSFVRMVLSFQHAGNVTLDVPVMPQAQYYSTFSAAPSPSPSTGKHHHASASPSPSTATPGTPAAGTSSSPAPTSSPS